MNTTVHSSRSQHGFALVVALLLLVALSLIGVAALKNVSLQEKMAGNTYFRMVTFQEAESALMESSRAVGLSSTSVDGAPSGDDSDKATRNIIDTGGARDFWLKTTSWANTTTAAVLPTKNAGTESKWIREDFNQAESVEPCDRSKSAGTAQDNCYSKVYRITATADMAATGAKVVTQNFYFIPLDKTITTVVPPSGSPSAP
jgi:type IV pilus assembly protein PilX